MLEQQRPLGMGWYPVAEQSTRERPFGRAFRLQTTLCSNRFEVRHPVVRGFESGREPHSGNRGPTSRCREWSKPRIGRRCHWDLRWLSRRVDTSASHLVRDSRSRNAKHLERRDRSLETPRGRRPNNAPVPRRNRVPFDRSQSQLPNDQLERNSSTERAFGP